MFSPRRVQTSGFRWWSAQLFLPIILGAMSLLLIEPLPATLPGEWNEAPTPIDEVEWKIEEVFSKDGSSTYDKTMGKAWVQLTWECFKAMAFHEGRPAHFLLKKYPKDVTEDDAIRAFTPYLRGPKHDFNGEEKDSTVPGEETGVTNRGNGLALPGAGEDDGLSDSDDGNGGGGSENDEAPLEKEATAGDNGDNTAEERNGGGGFENEEAPISDNDDNAGPNDEAAGEEF